MMAILTEHLQSAARLSHLVSALTSLGLVIFIMSLVMYWHLKTNQIFEINICFFVVVRGCKHAPFLKDGE